MDQKELWWITIDLKQPAIIFTKLTTSNIRKSIIFSFKMPPNNRLTFWPKAWTYRRAHWFKMALTFCLFFRASSCSRTSIGLSCSTAYQGTVDRVIHRGSYTIGSVPMYVDCHCKILVEIVQCTIASSMSMCHRATISPLNMDEHVNNNELIFRSAASRTFGGGTNASSVEVQRLTSMLEKEPMKSALIQQRVFYC